MAPFDSPYAHGFVRVGAGVPAVRVVDPEFNVDATLELARRAAERHVNLTVFPELGLSSYTAEDLFHQASLLDGVSAGLARLVRASAEIATVIVVGAPLRFEGRLFNCGVVVHRGHVLGVAPKSYLPTYREFYEKRQFAAARDAMGKQVELLGESVPFGDDLVFEAVNVAGFEFHRTSTSITSRGLVIDRAGLPTSRIRHGVIVPAAPGQTSSRRSNVRSTTSPRSNGGSRCSCIASSRRASSNARRCPTARRSARVARSPRAVTGEHRATPPRGPGWTSSNEAFRRRA